MSCLLLTQAHLDELKNMDVKAIYLFGSRVCGMEHPFSDYDYAVLTGNPHDKGDPLYLKLYEMLSSISPRELANDVLDIVFLKSCGLELQFHVIRYGAVLYDTDPRARLRFEENTMLKYCDYRPILDAFDHAILESL